MLIIIIAHLQITIIEFNINQINWDTGAVWNQTLVNLNQPFHFDIDLYFGTKDANGTTVRAMNVKKWPLSLWMKPCRLKSV